MAVIAPKVAYPYIVSDPKIANGVPIIKGTRTTFRAIAAYYQMGMSVDEILTSLTHLTTSRVHSAPAYYFDHQEEIDRDLAESSDTAYWSQQVMEHPVSN